MFYQKKIDNSNLQEVNYLDELFLLDLRFDGPRWMYIRSELSYYIVKRIELEKVVVEEYGQYALDCYEKDRVSKA